MGDLAVAAEPLLEIFGPAINSALRALLSTLAGTLAFALAATGLAVFLAADGSFLRGLLTAGLCLPLGVVAAGLLSVKSAVLRGLLAGAEKLALGRSVMWLVFEQLGVRDGGGASAGDAAVVRLAERIPLGEAEARLRQAARRVLEGRAAKSGVRAWLARKLLAAVLERVERLTLARFRTAAAADGGVDLRRVRDELGLGIDALVAGEIRRQMLTVTVGVACVYLVAAVVIGAGVRTLNL